VAGEAPSRRRRRVRARVLQVVALYAPGAETVRVRLHRWRGVSIADGTFIGTAALIETERPDLVSIGSGVTVGIRSTIVAHFRGLTAAERGEGEERFSVVIEDDVFIGPGALILPGVRLGHGAVVTAGSVVTSSVPPLTMVQGNPAKPVARCGIALSLRTPPGEFYRRLQPLRSA
jgi:acetyltransferase-like isoleucine patch superfamily enzyme